MQAVEGEDEQRKKTKKTRAEISRNRGKKILRNHVTGNKREDIYEEREEETEKITG